MKHSSQLNQPLQEPAGNVEKDADTERAQHVAHLLAEAQVVRRAIGSKRSDKLSRLFDFLLQRTIEGRSPTEIEIANEVFSIGRTLEVPQDATVRVYVHRLRKALDGIYADKPGLRLLIPKGEYCLVLTEENAAFQGARVAEPPVDIAPPARPWRWLWIALTLVVVLNLTAWWSLRAGQSHEGKSSLAGTALWREIAQDGRPVTIVLGDYYLFAETAERTEPAVGQPRLVRDPSINAREDLDIYLMAHPEEISRIADLDLRYVPSSAVIALGDIFRAVRSLKKDPALRPRLIPVSQLTPEILKSSDIVFVGHLSGLGTLLRNPLFQASSFKIGATYDELVDSVTARRYQSDGGVVAAEERMARRDYGYVANLPGPSGNRIIIVAGTRDPALLQMAELANDAAKLRVMNRRVAARPEGFEALYQVRTMGNLNLRGQLLIERPLRSRGVWDRSTPSQRFPNDTYEGSGHAAK